MTCGRRAEPAAARAPPRVVGVREVARQNHPLWRVSPRGRSWPVRQQRGYVRPPVAGGGARAARLPRQPRPPPPPADPSRAGVSYSASRCRGEAGHPRSGSPAVAYSTAGPHCQFARLDSVAELPLPPRRLARRARRCGGCSPRADHRRATDDPHTPPPSRSVSQNTHSRLDAAAGARPGRPVPRLVTRQWDFGSVPASARHWGGGCHPSHA